MVKMNTLSAKGLRHGDRTFSKDLRVVQLLMCLLHHREIVRLNHNNVIAICGLREHNWPCPLGGRNTDANNLQAGCYLRCTD